MHTLRLTFLALLPFTLQVSNLAAQPQNPGGPGGGQGGNQNKLKITWSNTGAQPGDKLSTIDLSITGPLTLEASTENNPHQEGLMAPSMQVAASGATTYSITGSGTNSGNISTNATSSFAIWSTNMESASARSTRYNKNNSAIVHLSNRTLTPNGSAYTELTAHVFLQMQLAGEPVGLLFMPTYESSSNSNATMPRITGEYYYLNNIDGTFLMDWSFEYTNYFNALWSLSYDPDDPTIPAIVSTELEVVFEETTDTDFDEFVHRINTKFWMDHVADITSTTPGIGAASCFASGQCAIAVGIGSYFAFNDNIRKASFCSNTVKPIGK